MPTSTAEPFDTTLVQTVLPAAVGVAADLASTDALPGSRWVLLAEDGRLTGLDADTLEWTRLGRATVPAEPEREPWHHHVPRRRLRVTLALDGGDYHPETVPSSFAFAELRGRTLAIHRTAWNRLDVSDPATGELLSDRRPTNDSSSQRRPEHDLDYFHGALLVSPASARILDDGWVWHPVGIPSSWSLERWLDNAWESEDGPSRVDLCARSYYWNGPVAWLDDERVAIGGIGDDDNEMVSGARIFDLTARGKAGPPWRSDWEIALETKAFAGPADTFFSDGKWLFSSDETGLSRWDPDTGARTGHVPGFRPSRYHRGARELVELREGLLVRMVV